MAERSRLYTPPGPVAKAFLESDAFFRGIMGPIGSGKSTACVIEILRQAMAYPPGPDGIRRPRWAITRNTYPELKSTTMETWFQWVPREFGKVSWAAPITHRVVQPGLDMEVMFFPLDRDEDVRKLLSLELTGIWFNEARYAPKALIDAATGRVGRWVPYPAARDAWAGIIADTNPPDTESWWYNLAEGAGDDRAKEMQAETLRLEEDLRKMGVLRPGQKLFEFFKQPSGLSPEAENLENLRKGYYQVAAANKTEDYVKVYIHGEYGFLVEGKPVHPSYQDSVHASATTLDPIPGLPVMVGADFGLTPAAVFGQCLPNGQWRIFAEVPTDRAGPKNFGKLLRTFMASRYPDFEVIQATGDPAGTAGDEGETYFDILKAETGWNWKPAPTNDAEIRREALRGPLGRMIDGKPGIVISPECTTIRKGLVSGFHYKYIKTSNGAQTHEEPAKNHYSHTCEALEYLVLGGGEYDVVHQRDPKARANMPKIATGISDDPFSHGKPDMEPRRFETAADIIKWRERRHRQSGARIAKTDD